MVKRTSAVALAVAMTLGWASLSGTAWAARDPASGPVCDNNSWGAGNSYACTWATYDKYSVFGQVYNYTFDPTVVNEMCDGFGHNCVTYQARSAVGGPYVNFYTDYKANQSNHVFRARASWNDYVTDIRYTNSVSNFAEWMQP